MFLAQCIHETGCFKWVRELGKPEYFNKYDFRKDLGNVYKGDGGKYKGRGFIQLTGRANYEKAGEFLHLPLVEQPELVESYTIAALVAGWYWKNKNLNYWSDVSDLKKVTFLINGGYNGLEDRQNWYNICLEILNCKK